jgi:hypothetical protein
MARETKRIDWEAVETDYRAGVKTLRAIAEECGCSHSNINKKAKQEGWTRDLSAKIKVETAKLVTTAAVTKKVTTETKKASEREIIDANANLLSGVRLGQRDRIVKANSLARALFAELEAEGATSELSLHSRVDTNKKLVDTLKTLQDMETKAYSLDDEPEDDKGVNILTMSNKQLEAIAKRGI